jgi:hypothetical protein
LIANKKRESEASKFHRECFKAHGRACYFCGKDASDAMHLVGRATLGPRRYECAVENSRPGCRACHTRQTNGELAFKPADMKRAIVALNRVLKVKIHAA